MTINNLDELELYNSSVGPVQTGDPNFYSWILRVVATLRNWFGKLEDKFEEIEDRITETMPLSTDDLPEGERNLYYTAGRVENELFATLIAGPGILLEPILGADAKLQISSLIEFPNADQVSYDASSSLLGVNNVQAAIDVIVAEIKEIETTEPGDQTVDECVVIFQTVLLTPLQVDEAMVCGTIFVNGIMT